MVRPASFLLAFVSCALAQPEPDRVEARKLLEKSVELAGAARLEVHVMAMLHAGTGMSKIDKDRSIAWLRQAFAASAGLDGGLRDSLQSATVKALAAVSLNDAAALLRGMAEPARVTDAGDAAADAIVGKLIEAKDYDRAMEVLALIPETAEYPFNAARQLFEKLPAGDSRRVIAFGRAHQAYGRRPVGPFPDMLARHWREVPASMAQAALGSVINALRAIEEETHSAESYSTDKGTIKLGSRQAVEFFRVVAALRALDPKRCQEILTAYPDLKAAVEKFPDGRLSADAHETTRTTQGKDSSSWSTNATAAGDDDDDPSNMMWSSMFALLEQIREMTSAGPPPQGRMKDTLSPAKLAREALALAAKEPAKALERAERVDLPGARAEGVARIAETIAGRDEAEARAALGRAESILLDVKDAALTTFAWVAVGRARHKLKDEKLAWAALERAQSGVVEILRRDSNPERTNQAPREYWPSTWAGRIVAGSATMLMGARADALLEGVNDTDLVLLERLQVAETLLGIVPTSMNVQVRY